MATFKICTRNISADGYYNVYIRITHERKIAYLRTDKRVKRTDITKNGDIKNNNVILLCSKIIDSYISLINQLEVKLSYLSLDELIIYLENDSAGISFSNFAKEYVDSMKKSGRINPARNFDIALRGLFTHAGKSDLLFSDITSKLINNWIDSLKNTNRAKNLYPNCIRVIFNAGVVHFNDYDKNVIKINHRPFERVKIPQAEIPEKRSICRDDITKFFSTTATLKRSTLAQDICKIIFCLAGINTVDLFVMEKASFKDGYLKYVRHKTRVKRGDYFQIRVPGLIIPLFEKYKGVDKLFCFSEMYQDFNSFNKNIRKGILEITDMKITSYSFRHSWATIAQNECGASTELVAFSLNHVSAHRVTEGYITKDFSPVDRINDQVIKYVFGDN